MQHDSDCQLHNEPAYRRGNMCNCSASHAIATAADAASLAQQLVEGGPADEEMTAATVALTTARNALSRAMAKANSGK